MKTRKLITTKPHKYGTRHMVAGDEYEVPPRHAIALVAGKKARFADNKPVRAVEKPKPVVAPQPEPEPQPEPQQPDHAVGAMTSDAAIDRLRLEATQLGINFDGRWGVARLQHEIAQAETRMRIFGLPVPFTGEKQKALNSPPMGSGGWYPIIREPFTGAWQRNMEINVDTASSFHADFACKTLIARDIAKLRVKLVEKDKNDIWSEITNAAFNPVLRRQNDYQTRNQFWECWVLSKLSRGNTYVLKVRDDRNVVTDLHVLDPTRVQPLVSDDGSVFYRLSSDNLAGIDAIVVPAREIIHDRMNCLFHPLVGTPPVFASGLASMVALNGQKASALLFENASVPGGILTLPGEVNQEEEQRFKEQWELRFSRSNLGRVAVMTGGVKYEKMTMTNLEVQMIENLKWSAEVVCSVYHVPPYKVGVGALPSYNNVQSLNVEYYSQSLQGHLEEIEELLDHALGIGGWAGTLGTEFDTDNLLRMDSITLVTTLQQAVGAGVMSPNEGRAKLDLKPVTGGDAPYLQQQNYSLEALAKRDAQDDPFKPATPPTPPQQPDQPVAVEPPPKPEAKEFAPQFTRALQAVYREAA